jgi:hypothetical protein
VHPTPLGRAKGDRNLCLERDAFRFAHNLNFENSWRIRRV